MSSDHEQPARVPGPSEEPIPVRMINEYVYCPRLAYLEWIQGEFADSADTIRGRRKHRVVDRRTRTDARIAPEDREDAQTRVVDGVWLDNPELGITGRLDRVEITGRHAVPIDIKKGGKPPAHVGVWDADRAQLCAQGLLLEAEGFTVTHGVAYYSSSRTRIEVPFDAETRRLTLETIAALRRMAAGEEIPPPLEDSPKCPGCSLVGICLPDEVDFLHHEPHEPEPEPPPRMILPSADERLPVYVQQQGIYIGKSQGRLVFKERGRIVAETPLHEISSLSLFGNVQFSTQALQTLCYHNIPVCLFTMNGWFYGIAQGMGHKNVHLRMAQHRAAHDPELRLAIARRLVSDKIRNCRTMLRRNGTDLPQDALTELTRLASRAERADSLPELLGIEGSAARTYFQHFTAMLKPRLRELPAFQMHGRNKRPPKDPINALLSLTYALLTKTWMVTTLAAGFDPYLGFYHTPKYGRPALALDLMEPFRPLIADSTVISAVNNRIVKPTDFSTKLGSVALKPHARQKLIQAYERRLQQRITHPVFQYKVSYRQTFEVQARLLGRFITGEIDQPPEFFRR
jgi:CRISPR-associated protein Cas1